MKSAQFENACKGIGKEIINGRPEEKSHGK